MIFYFLWPVGGVVAATAAANKASFFFLFSFSFSNLFTVIIRSAVSRMHFRRSETISH